MGVVVSLNSYVAEVTPAYRNLIGFPCVISASMSVAFDVLFLVSYGFDAFDNEPLASEYQR